VSRWLLVVAAGLGITWAGEQGRTPIKVEPHIQETIDLMAGFTERTGLASDRPPEQYLWTDAFAVCNYPRLGGRNRRRPLRAPR
jgi:hypothetical protein